MKRFLALLLVLCAIPAYASGSILPSSGTLSWGYTRDLDSDFKAIPSASGVWSLGSHLAIRSGASYFQDRSALNRRSYFLPLTTGFRFYAGGTTEHTRGLFLDASPALFLARIPNRQGRQVFRVPPGVEFGAGIRVPAFDGSRVEVGLSYLHSKRLGSSSVVEPLVISPDEVKYPSLSLFTLRVGVGWGD